MIQSCDNFAHVTTDQLSWHVQNFDMIRSSFVKSQQQNFTGLWAHKLCEIGLRWHHSWRSFLDSPDSIVNLTSRHRSVNTNMLWFCIYEVMRQNISCNIYWVGCPASNHYCQWIYPPTAPFKLSFKCTPIRYITAVMITMGACVDPNEKKKRFRLYTLRPRQDGRHFCRRRFDMCFLEWKLLNFK